MPHDRGNANSGVRPSAALARRDVWEQIVRSSWARAASWLAVLGLAIGNWAVTDGPGAFAAWLPVDLGFLVALHLSWIVAAMIAILTWNGARGQHCGEVPCGR